MAKRGQYKRGAKADSVRQRRYQGSLRQKKRRAMRNKARRKALRSGRVKKGDDLEVDHLNRRSLKGQTRVVHRTTNRRKNSPLWKRRRRRR